MSVEVERVDPCSSLRPGELLSQGDRPFLVPDSVDARIRERRWSPAGLRSLVGAREVSVTRAEGGKFDYTLEGAPAYTDTTLPFAEALGLIAASRPPGACYYLRRSQLSELGLDAEAWLPRVFRFTRAAERTERLWVSSEGSITPLHYDTRNNLLTQMHGTKVVTLFPSSEHARMYPLGFTGTNLLSHVDPEAVDDRRFPDFPSEMRLTVGLKPGDTLFIPPFWWHHVRSREFSISVNVFWQLRPEQCLVANASEYLRVMYGRDGLEELFAGAEEEPKPLRCARLAERAHERGLGCAATLFCAAAARLTLRAPPRASEGIVPARGSDDDADDTAEKLTARERARLEHCIFLGDLAALHGKAPKLSELGGMLAEVSELISRGVARTL